MNNTKPPWYLPFAPYVILAAILLAVYSVSSFVLSGAENIPFGDSIKLFEGGPGSITEEVKKTVESVLAAIDEKLEKKVVSDERPAPQTLREPQTILDFKSGKVNAVLKSMATGGFEPEFTVELDKKSGKPSSARLSALAGGNIKTKDFASGAIVMRPAVSVKEAQAIEISMKGNGLVSVGIGVMGKKGDTLIRWDWPSVALDGNYRHETLRFTDSDIWEYDTGQKKYIKLRRWVAPDSLEQLRIYIKPRHLEIQKGKVTVWVESVTLR